MTDDTTGGGHKGREREGADSRPTEDGGDNWQQQSGYGERVLDPDKGQEAAAEEADEADTDQAE